MLSIYKYGRERKKNCSMIEAVDLDRHVDLSDYNRHLTHTPENPKILLICWLHKTCLSILSNEDSK